jgi:hypothetical protein
MISEKSAYARIRTHASPRRGHILKCIGWIKIPGVPHRLGAQKKTL